MMNFMSIEKFFPYEKPRKYQIEALKTIYEYFESGVKLVLLDAPVGFGKSAVNTALCRYYAPSIYTTPQLSLIDQILRDEYLGKYFVEIKGRDNYQCIKDIMLSPIKFGMCKRYKDYPCNVFVECPYYSQKIKAIKSPIALMSLAYFTVDAYLEPPNFSNRNLVIIDEGHFLAEKIIEHVSLELSSRTLPYKIWKYWKEALKGGIPSKNEIKAIVDSCISEYDTIQTKLYGGLDENEVKEKVKIEEFLVKAGNYLTTVDLTDWICNNTNDGFILTPVYGRLFCSDLIWNRAERFVVSSATILSPEMFVKETGADLRFSNEEIIHIKVPMIFPKERRKIVDFSSGKLRKDLQEENLPQAVEDLKKVFELNKGKNIAVHFPSYDLAKKVYDMIGDKRIVLCEPNNRNEKLINWIKNGGIFFAVSFHEGQDWKYDICRVNVIFKTLYPDLKDKRVWYRVKNNKDFSWLMYIALVNCLQAYGRAIRSEDDEMVCYIMDSSFWELIKRKWTWLPEWFKEVVPETRWPEKYRKKSNMKKTGEG